MRSKDVWKDSPTHGQVAARHIGDDIVKSLQSTRGGLVYTKSNDFQHSYFVDHYEFYRLYLVPSFLIPSDESDFQNTEIGKGWVRREALDLLSYSYSETPSGHFSIPRNLAFAEIEELVVFSYQAENRRLAERSRQIVKERGWHERIVGLDQEIPNMDQRGYSPFAEPWNHPSSAYAQYPRPRVEDGDGLYQSGRGAYDRAPTEPQDANPGSQPNGVEGAREIKPSVPEVRFTVPRLDPTRRPTRVPPPPRRKPASGGSRREIQRQRQEQELREAMAKLERLKSNRDEAETTKNYALKSDLEYYAIPDLESRIEKLKLDGERDGQGPAAERQGQVPHTVVETDSEGSERAESKAVNVDDSDAGSAADVIYE